MNKLKKKYVAPNVLIIKLGQELMLNTSGIADDSEIYSRENDVPSSFWGRVGASDAEEEE